MTCENCCIEATRYGRDRKGQQRWRCKTCGRSFSEIQANPLGDMRIGQDKAVQALQMLIEGCSVRSVERMTGLHRDTVGRLIVQVGTLCERFMERRINNVPVQDVQIDELWSFVKMKQRTKNKLGIKDAFIGDAWTFVGFERNTKLVLAWHLGNRNRDNAIQFLDKLNWVTALRFQLSSDNWGGYADTVHHCLGSKVDYATVEKQFAQPPSNEARYSPPVVVGVKKQARLGSPNPKQMCTSHVERQNLTIRTFMKRFARLTLSFSKKWENLRAALAWFFCYYNFGRVHGSLRVTPAMESKLTDHVWSIEEILEAVAN